jgi:hypothetical protein
MDFGANVSNSTNSGGSVPQWAAIQMRETFPRETFPIHGDHLALNDRNISAYGSGLGISAHSVPWCMLQNPSNLAFNSAISQQMWGLLGNVIPTDPQIEIQRQHELKSMQQEIDRHQLLLHNDLQNQTLLPMSYLDRPHHDKVRGTHPCTSIQEHRNAYNDHHAAIAAYGNPDNALPPVSCSRPSIKDSPEIHAAARPKAASASSPFPHSPHNPPSLPDALIKLAPSPLIPPPRDQPAAAPTDADADPADVDKSRSADGKRSRGRPRGSKDRQVLLPPPPARPPPAQRRSLSNGAAASLRACRRAMRSSKI